MKAGVVSHIAQLSQIPITAQEEKALESAFDATLKVVDKLNELEVTHVEPTHQITGLQNVYRADIVEVNNMFTQQQALQNAAETYQGFFVSDRQIDD